jgi:hypothetical protein
MNSGVILLVLVMCQPSCLFAQTVPANQSHDPKTAVQRKSVGVPRPAMAPTAGTWKYRKRG